MTEFVMNELLTVGYAEEADNTNASDNTSATTSDTPSDTPTSNSSSAVSSIVIMVAMVAIFYFLLIRPQRKKDKAVKNMLNSLKVGDRICTIGGIYGTITGMKNDTVVLSIGGQQNPVVIARWAIRSVEDAEVENDADLSSDK